MTRVVLVRHGESQVSVDGLVGGLLTCSGLSDLGRRQAAALRDRLTATGELGQVDALLASTLPRARETAEIIAPAIGGLAVVEDQDFCERHPGEADGLTYTVALEKYGVPELSDDPHLALSPGGETWMQFHSRIGGAMRRTVGAHRDRTVVIACHAGVVDAALRSLLDLPVVGGFELYTHNTAITELVLVPEDERRPAPRWRLLRYNDAAHLASIS